MIDIYVIYLQRDEDLFFDQSSDEVRVSIKYHSLHCFTTL